MGRSAGPVVHCHARRGQARGSTRAASSGASCLLLPDARLAVRGRGRRAGDVHQGVARFRAVRGPSSAAILALPHRDQRFPGHAEREGAARPADGSRPCARARRVQPQHAAGGDLDRADPGRRPRLLTGSRPRRRSRLARDDPPRVRRRVAAPPAETAGSAHPVRGSALEGSRGRRASRHERRFGQQRAPARPRDSRGEQPERGGHVALRRRGQTPSSSRATSRPSSNTTWTRSPR